MKAELLRIQAETKAKGDTARSSTLCATNAGKRVREEEGFASSSAAASKEDEGGGAGAGAGAGGAGAGAGEGSATRAATKRKVRRELKLKGIQEVIGLDRADEADGATDEAEE